MCARTVERESSSVGPLPTSAGRRSLAPSTTRLTDFRSFTFASARTVVLCFDRDLGERVAWLDDVRDRRRRSSRQHRRTATAAECRQGCGAGDRRPPQGPGSSGSGRARPWSTRRSGRRRRAAGDDPPAQAGTGAPRRPTRTRPARARVWRRAAGRAHRAPARARAQLTGDRESASAAGTCAAPWRSSAPRHRRSCRSTSPSSATRPGGLRSRDQARRARSAPPTRALAIKARIKVRRRTGFGPSWDRPPASCKSLQIDNISGCKRFGDFAPGFASTAHLPVEGRGLKETVDIPARIAELRSVLLETRSDDLRKAIQAAIEDCRRKLAEARRRPGARREYAAPFGVLGSMDINERES